MGRKQEKQRKLTATEQKRKEKFEILEAELAEQGYCKKDLTISIAYANVMAIVLGLPIIVVLVIAFILCNTSGSVEIGMNTLLWLMLLIVLIVVHELIHGMAWAVFAPDHWKAIEFGFMAQYLTPYCTCGQPLKRYQYIIGALMPTLVLGILPAVAAIFTGSLFWLSIGCIMVLGGGGDMTIVLKMLRYHSTAAEIIYVDHPYAAGIVLFERHHKKSSD